MVFGVDEGPVAKHIWFIWWGLIAPCWQDYVVDVDSVLLEVCHDLSSGACDNVRASALIPTIDGKLHDDLVVLIGEVGDNGAMLFPGDVTSLDAKCSPRVVVGVVDVGAPVRQVVEGSHRWN